MDKFQILLKGGIIYGVNSYCSIRIIGNMGGKQDDLCQQNIYWIQTWLSFYKKVYGRVIVGLGIDPDSDNKNDFYEKVVNETADWCLRFFIDINNKMW